MVTPDEEIAYLVASGMSEYAARRRVSSALYEESLDVCSLEMVHSTAIRDRAARIAAIEAAKRPTCATCRFMSPDAHGLDVYEPEDEDMHETAHHACLRIIHGNGGAHYHTVKNEPALTTDGSGYSARLIVLPTFSCALHEAKEG